MPTRIDPDRLLNCLGVLLGPHGGIRGIEDVSRVANLMSKFSKKLVSKCIYVQILKATSEEILNVFLSDSGWDLIHTWFSDAVANENWPLTRELLELYLQCPVTLERLRENDTPKIIKGLFKESEEEQIKTLSSQIKDKWTDLTKIQKPQTPKKKLASPRGRARGRGARGRSRGGVVRGRGRGRGGAKKKIFLGEDEDESDLTSEESEISESEVLRNSEIKQNNAATKESRIDKSADEDNDSSKEELPKLRIVKRGGKMVVKSSDVNSQDIEDPNTTLGKENDVGEDDDLDAVVRPKRKAAMKVRRLIEEEFKSDEESESSSSKTESETTEVSKTSEEQNAQKEAQSKQEKETEESSKLNEDESAKLELQDKDDDKKEKKPKSTDSKDRSSTDFKKEHVKESAYRSDRHKDIKSSSEKKSSRDREKHRDRHSSSDRRNSSDISRSKDKERSKEKERTKDRHNRDSDRSRDRDRDRHRHHHHNRESDQAKKDQETLDQIKSMSNLNSLKLAKIPKKADGKGEKNESRPKNFSILDKTSNERSSTVKVPKSKYRSTGLEEDSSPAAKVSRKDVVSKKSSSPLPPLSKPQKRTSPEPARSQASPAEKKQKLENAETKSNDKPGIKLIKAKPLSGIHESSGFMDALIGGVKDVRSRRKRRNSQSKDGDTPTTPTTPPSNKQSPPLVKPQFKFYQDTLEDSEMKSENDVEVKKEIKEEYKEEEDETKQEEEIKENGEEDEAEKVEDETTGDALVKTEPSSGDSSGILLYHRNSNKKKKTVRFKPEEELQTIRYFELDETERVNVNKLKFGDMTQMEKRKEKENIEMARRMAQKESNDYVKWPGPLYLVEIPHDIQTKFYDKLGSKSEEKNIQFAREKSVLQALYFSKDMIPDTPKEPDPETVIPSEATLIPMEDVQGQNNVKDYRKVPWPMPRVAPVEPPGHFMGNPMGNFGPGPMPPGPPNFMGGGMFMGGPGPGPGPGGMMGPPGPNMGMPDGNGGGWRSADGRVYTDDMTSPPQDFQGFPNPGFGPGGMMPGMNMVPGMMNQPNFGGNPGGPGFNPQGFNQPFDPNFEMGPFNEGDQPNFQQGGGGRRNWAGGRSDRRNDRRGPNRGNDRVGICKFYMNGYCRLGRKCSFRHPVD